jgi:hypothetical protein
MLQYIYVGCAVKKAEKNGQNNNCIAYYNSIRSISIFERTNIYKTKKATLIRRFLFCNQFYYFSNNVITNRPIFLYCNIFYFVVNINRHCNYHPFITFCYRQSITSVIYYIINILVLTIVYHHDILVI